MKLPNKFKTPVIRCPHCGAEYLPGEIYIPGSLIGQPVELVKDSVGKIIYEEYTESKAPDMIERYICDQCDKSFVIEAQVTYKTRAEDVVKDFKTEYVSLLDN